MAQRYPTPNAVRSQAVSIANSHLVESWRAPSPQDEPNTECNDYEPNPKDPRRQIGRRESGPKSRRQHHPQLVQDHSSLVLLEKPNYGSPHQQYTDRHRSEDRDRCNGFVKTTARTTTVDHLAEYALTRPNASAARTVAYPCSPLLTVATGTPMARTRLPSHESRRSFDVPRAARTPAYMQRPTVHLRPLPASCNSPHAHPTGQAGSALARRRGFLGPGEEASS